MSNIESISHTEQNIEAFNEEELILRWESVVEKINQSTMRQDKHTNNVTLIAVSKTKPVHMLWTLAKQGQVNFGENYLQEALYKITETSNKTDYDITWHYIGRIQRNKTRDIAENFAWVHTVDRLIIAQRLHEQRPNNMAMLNVLLQVNIDSEEGKSGCHAEELVDLIQQMLPLNRLLLRGLMIIPKKSISSEKNNAFQRTQELFNSIKIAFPMLQDWDTLSMGMSADIHEAIESGSTMVRVGTDIFGARN